MHRYTMRTVIGLLAIILLVGGLSACKSDLIDNKEQEQEEKTEATEVEETKVKQVDLSLPQFNLAIEEIPVESFDNMKTEKQVYEEISDRGFAAKNACYDSSDSGELLEKTWYIKENSESKHPMYFLDTGVDWVLVQCNGYYYAAPMAYNEKQQKSKNIGVIVSESNVIYYFDNETKTIKSEIPNGYKMILVEKLTEDSIKSLGYSDFVVGEEEKDKYISDKAVFELPYIIGTEGVNEIKAYEEFSKRNIDYDVRYNMSSSGSVLRTPVELTPETLTKKKHPYYWTGWRDRLYFYSFGNLYQVPLDYNRRLEGTDNIRLIFSETDEIRYLNPFTKEVETEVPDGYKLIKVDSIPFEYREIEELDQFKVPENEIPKYRKKTAIKPIFNMEPGVTKLEDAKNIQTESEAFLDFASRGFLEGPIMTKTNMGKYPQYHEYPISPASTTKHPRYYYENIVGNEMCMLYLCNGQIYAEFITFNKDNEGKPYRGVLFTENTYITEFDEKAFKFITHKDLRGWEIVKVDRLDYETLAYYMTGRGRGELWDLARITYD